MTPPDAPTPPEAPELATLPPGLLILIDKADDWLEASKLANRDFATAQHGIAADLKRKAFVEFIHASVRENPKTLQTGLSLLRSLARRLQEAEAEREFLTGVIAERNEELRAIFVALHPECPAHPGVANHCHPSTCDCFAADYMERQIPAQLQQAHSAGVAEGIERAAKALQPWIDAPKGAGMRAGPPVPPSIRMWAGYMQDAIRALGRDQEGKTNG